MKQKTTEWGRMGAALILGVCVLLAGYMVPNMGTASPGSSQVGNPAANIEQIDWQTVDHSPAAAIAEAAAIASSPSENNQAGAAIPKPLEAVAPVASYRPANIDEPAAIRARVDAIEARLTKLETDALAASKPKPASVSPLPPSTIIYSEPVRIESTAIYSEPVVYRSSANTVCVGGVCRTTAAPVYNPPPRRTLFRRW